MILLFGDVNAAGCADDFAQGRTGDLWVRMQFLICPITKKRVLNFLSPFDRIANELDVSEKLWIVSETYSRFS